jgi:poly(3-hydroxyoctanoate) depolymerase
VNQRVIAMLVPHATLHVVKGGGHLVLLDSAEQVGPVITSFLRGDGAPDPASRHM